MSGDGVVSRRPVGNALSSYCRSVSSRRVVANRR